MHPDYHSDHPANCPICGMPLTEHRASGPRAATRRPSTLPHGDVQVRSERQQAIGVRVGVVSRWPAPAAADDRRVVADENRTYPIVAAVSGWIRNVRTSRPATSCKKDQALASFFAPDAQLEGRKQALLRRSRDALSRGGPAEGAVALRAKPVEEVERLADAVAQPGSLQHTAPQLAKRAEMVHDIRVISPADGVVLKRSVCPASRSTAVSSSTGIAD
jgi:hypothetical protein